MRSRQLYRLIALLPVALACDKVGDARAVDAAREDTAAGAAPDAGVDGPPDGSRFGTARPCDPFTPGEPPITRTSGALAIGRHRDGTVYVVDKPWVDERVFSSEGPGRVYFRRVVAAERPELYLFATSGPGQPFALKLAFGSNPRLRMGVFRGRSEATDFAIGSEGDELEVLEASTAPLAGVEFRDLPAAAVVVYFAWLEDGRRLAVMKPEKDVSHEGFRLFLGPSTAMIERPIRSVVAADGNKNWNIKFALDGAEAEATFPVKGAEPGTLKAGGGTVSLTALPTDTALRGHDYGCL